MPKFDSVQVRALLERIVGLELPALRDASLRARPRKERTEEIRRLLWSCFLQRGVISEMSWAHHRGPHEPDLRNCPDCQLRWRAKERVEAVILAAFPDLADRSEHSTDYFDSVLSVN